MLKEYLIAIAQHERDCLEDLHSLSLIAEQRSFNRLERRAAERALQVLIEACVGIVKHWLKAENKNQSLDAYQNFNKLAELQKISQDELKQWRKIIGLRNALVHDYLTIDNELLEQLISQRRYEFLSDFLAKAYQALELK